MLKTIVLAVVAWAIIALRLLSHHLLFRLVMVAHRLLVLTPMPLLVHHPLSLDQTWHRVQAALTPTPIPTLTPTLIPLQVGLVIGRFKVVVIKPNVAV